MTSRQPGPPLARPPFDRRHPLKNAPFLGQLFLPRLLSRQSLRQPPQAQSNHRQASPHALGRRCGFCNGFSSPWAPRERWTALTAPLPLEFSVAHNYGTSTASASASAQNKRCLKDELLHRSETTTLLSPPSPSPLCFNDLHLRLLPSQPTTHATSPPSVSPATTGTMKASPWCRNIRENFCS